MSQIQAQLMLNRYRMWAISKQLVALAAVGLLAGYVLSQHLHAAEPLAGPDLPDAPVAAAPGDVEVLDRGPIHEAFAEPVDPGEVEPLVVRRPPPALIEEVPPEFRPEGDRVEWLGGYWMWSFEHDDFIWVSGVWRNIPPGRQWVPGYWEQVADGFRWVPGYWGLVAQAEMPLLPVPPASLEAGPSSPAPAGNYFWIPGCWLWGQDHYAWRPGYWYGGHADWVWVPARYVTGVGGCRFVAGYWDHPLDRRGWLFAPARIALGVALRPHFVYRPYRVVDSRFLLTSLYVHRRGHHYHFGAYDRSLASSVGLQLWLNWGNSGRHRYDPLVSYYRSDYGPRHAQWVQAVEHHASDHGRGGRNRIDLVKPINQIAKEDPLHGHAVRHLSAAEVDKYKSRWTQVRQATGRPNSRIDSAAGNPPGTAVVRSRENVAPRGTFAPRPGAELSGTAGTPSGESGDRRATGGRRQAVGFGPRQDAVTGTGAGTGAGTGEGARRAVRDGNLVTRDPLSGTRQSGVGRSVIRQPALGQPATDPSVVRPAPRQPFTGQPAGNPPGPSIRRRVELPNTSGQPRVPGTASPGSRIISPQPLPGPTNSLGSGASPIDRGRVGGRDSQFPWGSGGRPAYAPTRATPRQLGPVPVSPGQVSGSPSVIRNAVPSRIPSRPGVSSGIASPSGGGGRPAFSPAPRARYAPGGGAGTATRTFSGAPQPRSQGQQFQPQRGGGGPAARGGGAVPSGRGGTGRGGRGR
jgi:hypothetical protein